MAQVDALTAYLMSNDAEVVAAARAQLDARVKAGERNVFFKRNMTGMEQRMAGMPPPSQRPQHQLAAPAAQDASELDRFRAEADRAEERWDQAFEERRRQRRTPSTRPRSRTTRTSGTTMATAARKLR